MNYDLASRTEQFSHTIVGFCKNIYGDRFSQPLVTQLLRSGTSVGANYMEANGACSRKDFKNKIYICKKEIQETEYWLRIISKSKPESSDAIDPILKETRELVLIFNKISNTLKIEN